MRSVNQGKSVYEEYSELNTEPGSEFTRSLKENDHDDFLQLLKCMQQKWHVIANPRVLSSSRTLSSFQLPWIPCGGILMRVNLEDQAITYFILLATMNSIHIKICVSLSLTFCLKSQWRLCACKCVKPLFLHCHFYSFWGDSDPPVLAFGEPMWNLAFRVQCSDMVQRKKIPSCVGITINLTKISD